MSYVSFSVRSQNDFLSSEDEWVAEVEEGIHRP